MSYPFLIKKNFMASFLWLGFNCLKTVEPLWETSLPFTTKSPGDPDTHLRHLALTKG